MPNEELGLVFIVFSTPACSPGPVGATGGLTGGPQPARTETAGKPAGSICGRKGKPRQEKIWPPLLQAHQDLDRTVDRCCRAEPFPSDRHRVEYRFALYSLHLPAESFGMKRKSGLMMGIE
jgi:hypothetical protein